MSVLQLTRGDSALYSVTVFGPSGAIYDLTDCELEWTATNGTQSIAKTWSGGGIVVADPTLGEAVIHVVPGDTSSWPSSIIPLTWTLVLTTLDLDVYTIATGTLEVAVSGVPSPGPNACLITATFAQADGSALVGAFVRVRIFPVPVSTIAVDAEYVSLVAVDGFTDSAGLFEFTVPRSTRFRLEVPAVGVDHVGTAPDAATAALSDISLTAASVATAWDRAGSSWLWDGSCPARTVWPS